MRLSPLPTHFRQQISQGSLFLNVKENLKKFRLHTVCEEARCPNRTDCYSRGTLTFQILGNICTRRCGFCAESTGRPLEVDPLEPERIVNAVEKLKLSHVVITAPARDDLPDGGASIFSKTINLLHHAFKGMTVEVLVSDLQGCEKSISTILKSQPDIFNHNIETVRRLTPHVRAKATYDCSLKVLRFASQFSCQSYLSDKHRTRTKIKSGLMLGLGETIDELEETFCDLHTSGTHYLTVGQYLQPSPVHLPIKKFYTIKEFEVVKKIAERVDFEKIFCAPLIRSSYHADEMALNV